MQTIPPPPPKVTKSFLSQNMRNVLKRMQKIYIFLHTYVSNETVRIFHVNMATSDGWGLYILTWDKAVPETYNFVKRKH